MNDSEAFIRTITEHPDDDGPRLVYADYLEERGECDRAELIRVMVEENRLSRRTDRLGRGIGLRDRRLKTAFARYLEIMRRPDLPEVLGVPCLKRLTLALNLHPGDAPVGGVTLGLVDRLAISWADWSEYAAAIRKQQPVRKVKLTTRPSVKDAIEHDGSVIQRADLPNLWKFATWPGVEFEMPSYTEWRNYTSQYTNVTREDLERRLRQALAETTFVPPVGDL